MTDKRNMLESSNLCVAVVDDPLLKRNRRMGGRKIRGFATASEVDRFSSLFRVSQRDEREMMEEEIGRYCGWIERWLCVH